MSPEARQIVAGLLAVLLLVIAIRVQPAITAWRTRRRLLRAYRQDLEVFDSRHVDVWARQLGGREPPPR